nr:hepcidin-1-like [Oncorhynchus nerka]
MKAFSVAVAVVLVLACMFILESTAVPFSEVLTEEVGSIDSPVGEHQQPSPCVCREGFRASSVQRGWEVETWTKRLTMCLFPLFLHILFLAGIQEHFRFKRQSHLSLCRWCCNCCHNKGCGFCCKF